MRYIVLCLMIVCSIGCGQERIQTPKPRMYPKVDYPTRTYESLTLEACHFTFDRPAYSEVKTGIKFFGEESRHPCWFDLELPAFNGSIHFSYIPIGGEDTLDKLVADAFRIVEQHNTKAEYREELLIENENGVHGLQFNLEGPVASPINFFLTDTIQHFVRASLYFNASVAPDSIAPILNFVAEDMKTIVETFEWKQ